MSWLSKLAPTLFSAANENSLSLANVKFDFTLVKVEAPAEFSPLGLVLSQKRKVEAEDGSPHRTARRLGALFEQVIPSTPKLISAYGQRVSEIISNPGINPSGLSSHGPFQAYVGADATAMWAAATSGVSAIAMYLLACFLARSWDAKEAVSIWVELVADRKREIGEAYLGNSIIPESSLYSARQEISRQELALWDSSARSWLRSADEAKAREKDQFLLIIKNIHLPFPSGSTTFNKVINAWREAMIGVEETLCGRPQSILNGSVPLAIMAWHLFPNLIVLGDVVKNVEFGDNLIHRSGTCTIGAVATGQEDESTKWSLALSHLFYYGDRAEVQSQEDFTRVSMSQFLVVVLGSLMAVWNIQDSEIIPTAQWFSDVHDAVIVTNSNRPVKSWGGNIRNWFLPLGEAAKQVLLADGVQEKQDVLQLLHFGKRRAGSFLSRDLDKVPPFFGLRTPRVMSALQAEDETEWVIAQFRDIATKLHLQSNQAIILIRVNRPNQRLQYELASAVPVARLKRRNDGQSKSGMAHFRWVNDFISRSETHDDLTEISTLMHDEVEPSVSARLEAIRQKGETAYYGFKGTHFDTLGEFRWIRPPPTFLPAEPNSRAKSTYGDPIVGFTRLLGNFKFSLLVREDGIDHPNLSSQLSSLLLSEVIRPGDKAFGIDPTCSDVVNNFSFCLSYLNRLWIPGLPLSSFPLVSALSGAFYLPEDFVNSLNNLGYAISVYNTLGCATVSLGVVNTAKPLCERVLQAHCGIISRPHAFSYIALFDSGNVEISPSNFELALAMVVDNSIYVSSTVLTDPYLPSHSIKRLVGNIGRTGISILVPPRRLLRRGLSNSYKLVNHGQYNYKREDNFTGTSLHLSFTEWALPLNQANSHTIDQDVWQVESVISVRDKGEWLADIDPLDRLWWHNQRLLIPECQDPSHGAPRSSSQHFISLDNWEEFLDRPSDACAIMRAHGNWAARLAAICILGQDKADHLLKVCGPGPLCFACIDKELDGKPAILID